MPKLTVVQSRALAKTITPAQKAKLRKHVVMKGQGGAGLFSIIGSAGRWLGKNVAPVLSMLAEPVLKEIVLPMIKKKAGLGLRTVGGNGLRTVGGNGRRKR
jgi:hypothetical protein